MKKVVDGNTAAAMVAYKLSEVIPIYPITPSSPMAEYCDSCVAEGRKNIFGKLPTLIEMQSEGGAAGTLHGSLCGGAMSTTFTSSQGLLLMIPNLYKIAGEQLPCVFHVAARAIASHALSIFGDHSDVMAIRQTGAILLCSNSVQQAHDFALIAHILAYKTSLPVMHFFDGFRTSHEMQKIDIIEDDVIQKLLPIKEIEAFRNARMTPEKPYQKGTAQNPDVFFQNREASSAAYESVYQKLTDILHEFALLTGRQYQPFQLFGAKEPENVVVCMGSACECLEEVLSDSKDTALLSVHLFRPFDRQQLCRSLPKSVKKVIVLDRTKECGSREPLFLDVSSALSGVQVVGGRYGLGGKEFTPAMANAVLKNFQQMKDNFTVGIDDDVTHSSLPAVESAAKASHEQFEMKIWGLGSDGTVSASKSTIKILGEELGSYVQGYFEYDSKKSGSLTRSHVRVSKNPIKSTYLVQNADIVVVNNFSFVHRYDCLSGLKDAGTVLLNTIFSASEVDKVLPDVYKTRLQNRHAKLFVINAHKIAQECGLGNKINMVMQTALFKVSGIIPFAEAEKQIENYIQKTFAKKGKATIDKNLAASKRATQQIEQVDVDGLTLKSITLAEKNLQDEFYQKIMGPIERLEGDKLPVSVFDASGKVPLGTAEFEKRGFAAHLPVWLPANCIQCGQCVLACPHNAIRPVLVKGQTPEEIEFAKAFGVDGCFYRLQVSPEDCTGCGVCAKTCPAIKKALEMHDASEVLEKSKREFAQVEELKRAGRTQKNVPFSTDLPKGLQFKDCLFAFSGACAGCGETPYIRLATTLFGDRMMIANATGCSSIYGGSFPSCPYMKNEDGHGPAWANSLFEDNAEFGLGMKLANRYTPNGEKQSVWIIGGDGWAYDIGYGGLDHVLASGENVNILVLDTEVYSNTGGQASKSTPRGAMVKFANAGKKTKKKDLVAIAIASKNAYVAQVSLGANNLQCIKAFKEAEAFDGPSLIVAYCPCVNHGFDMSETTTEMRKAVECGYWSLLRFDPRQNKLTFDSVSDFDKYDNFIDGESRFAAIKELKGEEAEKLLEESKADAKQRLEFLKKLI